MQRWRSVRRLTLQAAAVALLAPGAVAAVAGDCAADDTQAAPPPILPERTRSLEVFTEAWTIIRDHFYDPKLHGVDWDAVRGELIEPARASVGRAAVSGVINRALDRLNASHLRHYTRDQREYYELIDVFHPEGVPERAWADGPRGPVRYVGVGLVTTVIEGRTHVLDVYPGGPADEAGLRVGDQLLWVEGSGGPGGPSQPARREWSDISPFRGRENQPTRIGIQRTADEASRRELTVTPERIQPRRAFLEAIRRDARLIETGADDAPGGIAYIRIRSYAHPSYHEQMLELLRTQFPDAGGLILDLRGGWGGAKPEYLDAFNPAGTRMSWKRRDDGAWRVGEGAWTKPLVVIIDRGTRSGKEMLSHALKVSGRARLVGERTAGAVLGGAPFFLSDGSLLLVAVSDVLVGGVRLEGVGVEPDVTVARTIAYGEGKDEQLDAAVAEMRRILGGSGAAPRTP